MRDRDGLRLDRRRLDLQRFGDRRRDDGRILEGGFDRELFGRRGVFDAEIIRTNGAYSFLGNAAVDGIAISTIELSLNRTTDERQRTNRKSYESNYVYSHSAFSAWLAKAAEK